MTRNNLQKRVPAWGAVAVAILAWSCGQGAAGTPDADGKVEEAVGDVPAADDLAPLDPGGEGDPSADDPSTDVAPDRADAQASDAPVEVFEPHPNPANVPMFDESEVVEFRLDFTAEAWAEFETYRQQGKKKYVHCSFAFGGDTFPDAACRSKGNPDYWKDEKKPQFLIRFNHWDKDQRFKGLRGLVLESNPFHAAPVRDRLGMWVMREAGVDAPRANHARVLKNGALLGLYMNIEAVDREFLEDHFADPTGNLYEDGYQLKTNEDVNDLTRLWELEGLIDDEPLEGDHTAFYAALETLMDVHQVLREMAAEVVLPTGDNFTNGGSNFYYYDHPGRGFLVIPWDLDDVISEWAPAEADPFEYWGEPELELPPSKLRLLMNQNPAWKQEFVDTLVAIRDGPYTKLLDRVTWVCAQVRPEVEADPARVAEDMADFDADCQEIRDRIQARIQFLKGKLGQ